MVIITNVNGKAHKDRVELVWRDISVDYLDTDTNETFYNVDISCLAKKKLYNGHCPYWWQVSTLYHYRLKDFIEYDGVIHQYCCEPKQVYNSAYVITKIRMINKDILKGEVYLHCGLDSAIEVFLPNLLMYKLVTQPISSDLYIPRYKFTKNWYVSCGAYHFKVNDVSALRHYISKLLLLINPKDYFESSLYHYDIVAGIYRKAKIQL